MEGSREGPEGGGPPRRLPRTFTTGALNDVMDPEVVPSSLHVIAPILRVANEVEEDNPRIAYLCRFYAFDKAHKLDPTSTGRGVRQFKTALLHKLEKDDVITLSQRKAKSDSREMQNYYQNYYNKYVKSLENNTGATMDRAHLARTYQTAAVLFDVLKAVNQTDHLDPQIEEAAKEVAAKKEIYVAFNILPLDPTSAFEPIMIVPEVKAAVTALRYIRGLPGIHESGAARQRGMDMDLFDWLQNMFGFQKDNVANQREHLILLLANVHARQVPKPDPLSKMSDAALSGVMRKLFKNYKRWCKFLDRKDHLRLPSLQQEIQQRKILYIGLYLLIWGEAANLRFMPECLCYIFHHMAGELSGMLAGNVSPLTGENVKPTYGGGCDSFLERVVTPIYEVIAAEVDHEKLRHSQWRNYDDLNEYFWSIDCFRLGWPMRDGGDFFKKPNKDKRRIFQRRIGGIGWVGKTNFVEVRSFLHIFRSFDRMWSFFVMSLQAMIIIAWNGSGSIGDAFSGSVFEKVLSIFITAAFLRLVQAIVDIGLIFKAWRSMKYTDILRYVLKVLVAIAWVIVLPVCYAHSWGDSTDFVSTFKDWLGQSRSPSLYVTAILVYLAPDVVNAVLFLFPMLRRAIEQSDVGIVQLLLWWDQPPMYVGRGMHESPFVLFKYTLFWVLLLSSKFLFSYYVEIQPLVKPTKKLMTSASRNKWFEMFPTGQDNMGVIISIWAPIILVFFMDTQIWYSIWLTIFGGITGAFSRLGEVRTLEMLKSRFMPLSGAFNANLVSTPDEDSVRSRRRGISLRKSYRPLDELYKSNDQNLEISPDEENQSQEMDIARIISDAHVEVAKFCQLWNAVIQTIRDEDYIKNSEMELLLIPYASNPNTSYIPWPAFLLRNKIASVVDTVKELSDQVNDEELSRKIGHDPYSNHAIAESYDLLKIILKAIVIGERERRIIDGLFEEVQKSIAHREFLKTFRISELPLLLAKIIELVKLLEKPDIATAEQMTFLLQDLLEVYERDVKREKENESEHFDASQGAHVEERLGNRKQELFQKSSIQYLPVLDSLKQMVKRLLLLITTEESTVDVPSNLEAKRRITFFTNSLFMDMPQPPKVHNMISFSVLTPYYGEEIVYTKDALTLENDDGVSILFYLQKIYPDEWDNFIERIDYKGPENDIWETEKVAAEVRNWASYRAQTLTRTARGMMYYRKALGLQAFFDMAQPTDIVRGHMEVLQPDSEEKKQSLLSATIEAITDMKFTYVVSCQEFGFHRRTGDVRANEILHLMEEYPAMRVAYIDEEEKDKRKEYYSVLMKAVKDSESGQVIYKIKLPGKPILGEGKAENQNHAIIFTRGEALQAIDMNQDFYLEEALKMRNLLQEFVEKEGVGSPSILGVREHIFTGSVSSLAGFMSNQESSFVTIVQRVLSNPLKVRFHYGHPDVFDRLFHLSRGGISKASCTINLSEDIFAGFNTILRRGNISHHEYIQVGKGRDMGLNQISRFEAKIANGNGEQTMSRDIYRLGHRVDFFRMLSVYFSTVGFYFNSLIVVLIVYVFLYGRIYLALSGLERTLGDAGLQDNVPLQFAMASQAIVQIGFLIALPMVMEIGLERGFRIALSEFVIMQLQLASVFFTFSMGTIVHFYGRTLLHGGAKYRPTGRAFVVFHAKFAENYRLYSRSHFTKGLELLVLLIVYDVYGAPGRKGAAYILITFLLWFLVGTWLFAPFLFNPSGFEWQKIVDDWDDWNKWVSNRGGIGVTEDKSWESWWEKEQAHLQKSGLRGQIIEILLSARFLMYQYGLVYHLHIARNKVDVSVYVLSWVVVLFVLALFKGVSLGKDRFSAEKQLEFRLVKGVLFLAGLASLIALFMAGHLAVADLFVGALAFLPSGWAIVQIAQVCKPIVRRLRMWDSVKALAWGYEYLMGVVLFAPIATLAWFPFISDFQTRILFNQAFSRGLQIQRILAGRKDKKVN